MHKRPVVVLDNLGDMTNRVKELRKAAGLTQDALAKLAGTTKNQLVKLEGGNRRLSDHWAQRLAPFLGVQAYELFMPEGAKEPLRFVPLIGDIACGNWREAIEHADGSVPAVAGGPSVFALRTSGNSMDKLITPGGYVYVDPDDRDLIEGKVYAVMNSEGETTAKLYRGQPARLIPCSNDASYQETIIGTDQFTVIGRVVGTYSPL